MLVTIAPCWQVIAGYDPDETTSVQMTVPDYFAALRTRSSTLRLGVARDFFFAGLDPEIEAAVNTALSVLERITGGLREVAIAASTQERLRNVVRAAEAYASMRTSFQSIQSFINRRL